MNSLIYNIKQVVQQIGRNKGMSFASVLAITAMMLILGLFFVISVNINLFSEMIQKDYDYVEVYLKDDVDEKQVDNIKGKLENISGVKNIEYRSKQEALKIMKQRWGESGYLLDSLGDNPLPDSIVINAEDNETANNINKFAKKIDGVEDVKYYKETVDKLTKASNFLQYSAIVIMIFLIVVSVIVVSNTIKLTVLNRSKEISIMKYVGATNWFVRGPFLIEGIFLGIVSSMIAAALTWLIYIQIEKLIGDDIMVILSSPLVPADYLAVNLLVIFLAIGVSVGASGSIVSMRKFLDK
ncbi:MAG: permease-like cell division protein FtsX [Christensenellales bacterium]